MSRVSVRCTDGNCRADTVSSTSPKTTLRLFASLPPPRAGFVIPGEAHMALHGPLVAPFLLRHFFRRIVRAHAIHELMAYDRSGNPQLYNVGESGPTLLAPAWPRGEIRTFVHGE